MDALSQSVRTLLEGGDDVDARKINMIKPTRLDDILYAARPEVAKNRIKTWRKNQPRDDRTVDAFVRELIEANLPVKSGRPRESAGDGERSAKRVRRSIHSESDIRRIDSLRKAGDTRCTICMDEFDKRFMIGCAAEDDCHFTCADCFRNYCRENVKSAMADQIKCTSCERRYPAYRVRCIVPAEELDHLVRKAIQMDVKVALGAGDVVAKLSCKVDKCGTVAVVMRDQIGDGTLTCLCNAVYCLKCGNFCHPAQLCPPADQGTLKWIDKNAKTCPGCGDAVQKNGGCNHFTHSKSAGGCGHEFCWLCFGNWRNHNINRCREIQQELKSR